MSVKSPLPVLAVRMGATLVVVVAAIGVALSWDGRACGYSLARRCGTSHVAPLIILVTWTLIALRQGLALGMAMRAKVALATESLGLAAVYSAVGSFCACLGLTIIAEGDDDLPLLGLALALFLALMNTNPYLAIFDRTDDKILISGTLWSRARRYRDARLTWLSVRQATQHERFTTRHVALSFPGAEIHKLTAATDDPTRIDDLSSLTGVPVAELQRLANDAP